MRAGRQLLHSQPRLHPLLRYELLTWIVLLGQRILIRAMLHRNRHPISISLAAWRNVGTVVSADGRAAQAREHLRSFGIAEGAVPVARGYMGAVALTLGPAASAWSDLCAHLVAVGRPTLLHDHQRAALPRHVHAHRDTVGTAAPRGFDVQTDGNADTLSAPAGRLPRAVRFALGLL